MARHLPKLCHHRRSGRAYATDPATRREVYFGFWGTPEAQAAYDRWLAVLLARRAEVPSGTPPGARVGMARLLSDYMTHAEGYYVKHGKPTSEVYNLRSVAALVNDLYGTSDAAAFGPAGFRAVRDQLVKAGLARDHVNQQLGRLRRIWKWAVAHELLPPECLVALQSVEPLAAGRTVAHETAPVEPVPLDVVARTIAAAPPLLASMLSLHLLASMRAQDVCCMRPCDIDTSGPVWCYSPWSWKTEHKSKSRRLFLGPKAQAVLAPLLAGKATDAWLFPGRRGKSLTPGAYRGQILRVCRQHKIPEWFPLQLRHTALTLVRQRYGLEAAQVAAGHARADVTQIYSARDEALAQKVAREMG